jgi:probable HAF family extracellular repeat protein
MVDLGTFGGSESLAQAVNNAGEVVGGSGTTDHFEHAFLWTRTGGMVDLGALSDGSSEAWGVNDPGQVVGLSIMASGGAHAFMWTKQHGMVDLGTLEGGDYVYPASAPRAVSPTGQVVGVAYNADQTLELGYSWTEKMGIVELPTGAFTSSYVEAFDMNARGEIVGVIYIDGELHGVVWTPVTQGG